LELGELAINTYDGKLYLRRSAAGNDTIVDVSAGYSLPVATTSVLGGVKVDGTSITVSQTGVISAGTAAYTINRQEIIGNGSTLTYILDVAPKAPDYVDLYIDGVYQKKDSFTAGSGTGIKNTFTGNGIQTDFVLTVTPVDASYIEVYLQGLLQKDTSAYTLTDDTVSFSEAIPTDTLIEIVIIDKKSQLILSEAPESGSLIEILTYSPTLNIKKMTLLATSTTAVFNMGYSLQAGDLCKVVWNGLYQHTDAYTTLDYTLTLSESIPAGDWLELTLITGSPIDATTSTTAATTIAENNDGIGVDTPIDLSKQVHKLSWTGSYAYTLDPGIEGQIIQFVPGAGTVSDIDITVSRLRTVVLGESTVSTNATYKPFGNVSQFPVVVTGIYTDDAWNFSADYTAGASGGGINPSSFSGDYNDLTNKPTIPSLTGYATETYVNTAVSDLVASAPSALNTLNELAQALGSDANYSTTVSTALGNRLRVDINTQSLTTQQKANAVTNLGLATVSTSGSYTDLTNKPTIPTAVSQLTNDSSFITGSSPAITTPTITGATVMKTGSTSVADEYVVYLNASTTTANQVLDTLAVASYTSVKYIVEAINSTGTELVEISLTYSGTTPYINTVTLISTVTPFQATYDATVTGGNLKLLVTPTNANTKFKVRATAFKLI
jgi:hypothetical protein